jgi:hypothetical protein
MICQAVRQTRASNRIQATHGPLIADGLTMKISVNLGRLGQVQDEPMKWELCILLARNKGTSTKHGMMINQKKE